MIPTHVYIKGFADATRVLLLGRIEYGDTLREMITISGEDIVKDAKFEFPFNHIEAGAHEIFVDMTGDNVLIKNTFVGLGYLKAAVEFLLLAEDIGWSWKKAIEKGSVRIYYPEPGDAPVFVAGEDYGVLIAPRVFSKNEEVVQ